MLRFIARIDAAAAASTAMRSCTHPTYACTQLRRPTFILFIHTLRVFLLGNSLSVSACRFIYLSLGVTTKRSLLVFSEALKIVKCVFGVCNECGEVLFCSGAAEPTERCRPCGLAHCLTLPRVQGQTRGLFVYFPFH